jgi:DNA-binding MarR family transcriptional regulator
VADHNLSLLWHFFATSQRVKVLVEAAMEAAPLTPDEYAVYSLLFDVGPLPPTELARRLGMPPTTMSHYVRALVQRGHAHRIASPSDGRSYLLALTDEGRSMHRASAATFETANQRFRAALSVDEAFLRRSLDAVGQAADTATAELAGTQATAAKAS